MAEYHYLYVFGPDGPPVRDVAHGLADAVRRKGAECKGPDELTPAPAGTVAAVLEGQSPPTKLCNWLLHLEGSALADVLEDADHVHGWTMRLLDLYQVDLPYLLGDVDPPDGVEIQVRLRQGTHRNTAPPFSYDYQNDYKTEP